MVLAAKLLFKFIQLLNSETKPSQMAAGACFGVIFGFSPFMTWHNLIIFLLVCLLRVNFSMFFLSAGVAKILAFALDPVFDSFGYWLLVDLKQARGLWIQIASTPVLPFFKLNNTVVIGSLVSGLLLFVPGFIFWIWFITQYRKHWREKIKDSKFVKGLKATKLYGTLSNIYDKYSSARDKWSQIT